MYLIRNKDGSIRKAHTEEYIQQGSNNVNYMDFAIMDLDNTEWSADCVFELPNGEIVQLASVQKQFIVDDEVFDGYRVYLSSAVLAYPGKLKIIGRNYDASGRVLYTYPFTQMVNTTAIDSAYDAPITIAQYNSFMALLATYMNAYDTHLIRKYPSLDSALEDIDKLTATEHVLISSGKDGYAIYYKANADDKELTLIVAQGGMADNYVKFTYYMTDVKGGVAKAIPTTDISNLANVYIKDGFLYTKATEVPILKIKKVDKLPEVGEVGTFYLVPNNDPKVNNKYIEYMYLDGGWEEIGETQIDFAASKFIINGKVDTADNSITFIELDGEKLEKACENNQSIVFIPSDTSLASVDLNIQKLGDNNYILKGSFSANSVGKITNYSCVIKAIDNSAIGTYSSQIAHEVDNEVDTTNKTISILIKN